MSTATRATPTAIPRSEARSLALDHQRWKQVEKLPCQVSVEARVAGFTLKDLLRLQVKSVVRSQLATSASPQVRVNGGIVATADFEVLGNRLAVRLTELA